MKVLLDTHALVWAVASPKSLSTSASLVIADLETEMFVSAASVWEIATKVRLGKLPEAVELERRMFEGVSAVGYTILPIDGGLALRSGRLPGIHGDPFDRIIAAQALTLDMPVISKDSKLDSFGVHRIW